MTEILGWLLAILWAIGLIILMNAVMKLGPIERHLKSINESMLKQNELLSLMLKRKEAPPLIPFSVARGDICRYCGSRAQEGETCEECRRKGG